jgi:hypothetical protein
MSGGLNQDCLVEGCKLMFNNYRHMGAGWGVAAGAKLIPANKRVTMRGCEAAFNEQGQGIWFDTNNEDIRLLENACHHNGDAGIVFEANKGGALIAGNLVYANNGRGIYVSGSQKTWVVHNTVAGNNQGIVVMARARNEPPRDNHLLNNLLINNYVTASTITRGADVILESPAAASQRRLLGCTSDYNIYASNSWTPLLRPNWVEDNTLALWRQRFGHDLHSKTLGVDYVLFGTDFRLTAEAKLDGTAGPLPEAVTRVWTPLNGNRVGSSATHWP